MYVCVRACVCVFICTCTTGPQAGYLTINSSISKSGVSFVHIRNSRFLVQSHTYTYIHTHTHIVHSVCIYGYTDYTPITHNQVYTIIHNVHTHPSCYVIQYIMYTEA